MAKGKGGPRGGRPGGRIGKGGVGPASGTSASTGATKKGTKHKGNKTRASHKSGSAATSVVVAISLMLGVPFLLFLASIGWIVAES